MGSLNLISVFSILDSNKAELINSFLLVNGIKLKEHEFSGFRCAIKHLLDAGVKGKKTSGYYINISSNQLMQEEIITEGAPPKVASMQV